jgi:hypothetical protein
MVNTELKLYFVGRDYVHQFSESIKIAISEKKSNYIQVICFFLRVALKEFVEYTNQYPGISD